MLRLRDLDEGDLGIYQEWMQDKELLRLTGTEPMNFEDVSRLLERSRTEECMVKIIEVDGKPIGDIDLFPSNNSINNGKEYEINMMIAMKEYRGKGYGKAALCQFLNDYVNLRSIVWAKILKENVASVRLFESVGFEQVNENVFGEVELRFAK